MQDGRTPLYVASREGCLDIVKALIERRANVEATKTVSFADIHMFLDCATALTTLVGAPHIP